MHVESRLIVIHVDLNTTAAHVLMDGGLLPEGVVEHSHPLTVVSDFIEDYLEIDPSWIDFRLIEVGFEGSNKLVFYYACMIPETIKEKQGQWITIGEINDRQTQEMVFKAGQELAARRGLR
jgi:hypothetical protein